jgi:hypothetical protein
MMLFLSTLACVAVLVMSKTPPVPGRYFDPDWITAAMSAVQMVLSFYLVVWLCRMFRAFERLLLILTGVESEEARMTLRGTLARMRQLIEELTANDN